MAKVFPYMKKIVIVEDDHAIAAMYEFKLSGSGYKVKVAHNGEHGLKVIESFEPDLVLLDLRMPTMHGDEMLHKLRQEDWGAGARVIVLTNISKSEAPMSLRLLNVDRYVVKAHSTPTQVVETIQEVLKEKVKQQ